MAVLGGGAAGLATALLLGRDGHDVTLVERDPFHVGRPLDALAWERRGLPHFRQPHALIPRGRLELREQLPDVYDALLAAGAYEVDLRPKLPGPLTASDVDLQYLAVRRPLIEWALRAAVTAEPSVRVIDAVEATGLALSEGRVVGVRIGGDVLDVDVVVDAMGRRGSTRAWLAAGGHPVDEPETTDCGVIYYCRYYALRDGFELPDGLWLLSPRGDLGYMAYATFPGDNRTFASVLAVPPGVPEWRRLKNPAVYQAAVARIPVLASWVDPEGVDPITEVLPMAGLRNSIRSLDGLPPGLFVVGDAFCHTDPVLAHGLAFALIHAAAVAAALREHADLGDASRSYREAVTPSAVERYQFASALDAQRLRLWTGGRVDPAHADGDFALFSVAAAGAVAFQDADVFRAFVRRIGLLDSTEVFDRDRALHQRIEAGFARIRATPRAPAGPPEAEMRELAGTVGVTD